MLVYCAWKTLILAHSQIVAAHAKTSVAAAIADLEREMAANEDLLPTDAADDLTQHIKNRNKNGGSRY